MEIKIKLSANGKLPEKQTAGSSGYDLFASHDQTIDANKLALIKLGFEMAIPLGFEAQIRSRSGLALKHSVFVLNSPGTIDSDYRQEVGVVLMNLGSEPYVVQKHMRIAQMVFSKVENVQFVNLDILNETNRHAGWGSTGV